MHSHILEYASIWGCISSGVALVGRGMLGINLGFMVFVEML
jgi:hypothetical protein